MTLEGLNIHQMVPNLKGDGMESLKTYKFILGIIPIIFNSSTNLFVASEKNTKITRKLCSNPPMVRARLAV